MDELHQRELTNELERRNSMNVTMNTERKTKEKQTKPKQKFSPLIKQTASAIPANQKKKESYEKKASPSSTVIDEKIRNDIDKYQLKRTKKEIDSSLLLMALLIAVLAVIVFFCYSCIKNVSIMDIS